MKNIAFIENEGWEWVFKGNPNIVVFMKVDDIQLDSDLGIDEWLEGNSKYYTQFCKEAQKKKGYTFNNFNDVLKYVKEKKEDIDPIVVIIELDGKIVPSSGKHRWCAAKKTGLEYIPCRIQRRLCWE